MNELIKYSPQAIANIQTVEEAKDGYEKLKSLLSYFRDDYDTAFDLAVSIIECAARGGELIEEMQENGELAKQGRPEKKFQTETFNLVDLGIKKAQSHRWQKIASLSTEERQEYYDKIWQKREKENRLKLPTMAGVLSIIRSLEREIDLERQRKEIEGLEPPSGLYNVIVIDPPWPYGTKYNDEGRRVSNPYPEMSLEKLANLEIPAAEDCILWLWTTHKFMRHSFALLDTWGFRDVAILTWVKDRMGIGTWLRSQSEFCIMAVKGKPKVDLTNQTTVIYGELREHSRKPDSFYELVDSLCVGYKLDYYSREQREGWINHGNRPEEFNVD